MAAEAHTFELTDLRKLTIQQQNAIDMLVTGSSDREAAEAVGVDRSTVTRWRLYHPAFQAELNAQRAAIWGTAKEKLRSLVPEAVDAIAEAIRNPENPDRAKLSLDLLRSIKMGEDLGRYDSRTDPEAIIYSGAEANQPPIVGLDAYDLRRQEMRLQAQLNGMTLGELDTLTAQAEERDAAEIRARRRAAREAKNLSLRAVNPEQNASDNDQPDFEFTID